MKNLMIVASRARPRSKSGRKLANGQFFLAFIFLPTGNGLSIFRTTTRSGFERCNKNSNPIINPIFYPIFYPIATRLPRIFICFQLIFGFGLHRQPAPTWPDKKGRPDNPFCTKFFRRTEVHTDKKLNNAAVALCITPAWRVAIALAK